MHITFYCLGWSLTKGKWRVIQSISQVAWNMRDVSLQRKWLPNRPAVVSTHWLIPWRWPILIKIRWRAPHSSPRIGSIRWIHHITVSIERGWRAKRASPGKGTIRRRHQVISSTERINLMSSSNKSLRSCPLDNNLTTSYYRSDWKESKKRNLLRLDSN